MTNLIPTSEKITVTDYPYGRLRCTLYDTIDFDFKKGFRHVTQTINPKTNRINNPKRSTYSDLMVRYYDEKNHIKIRCFSFNGLEELNTVTAFINEHFDLFTEKEKSYFYTQAVAMSKISMQASVIYGGSDVEALKPLFDDFVKNMIAGMRNPNENYFNVAFDIEAIDKTKPKDFQPFRTKKAVSILDM